MGRVVIFQLKSLLLTKSMTVDFLKPLFVGVELKAEARVVEVRNGREAVAEGGIYNAAGELCTKSSGTFVLVDSGTAKRKGLADDEFMRWFDDLFRS
jgi:acyl-coenzyme A thioesterase PaaI-like protein